MSKKFKKDWRVENPGLHLLYVKLGVQHLRAIDECRERLLAFSNLNLWDAALALARERAKLVRENAAYADANEVLKSITGK